MKTLLFLLLSAAALVAAPPQFPSREDNPWVITDKTAWINWKAVERPWRVVGGETNYVPRADGWYWLNADVISVDGDRLLVEAVCSRTTGDITKQIIILRNYPSRVVDGDPIRGIAAKQIADESYVTVLGAKKTVRAFDFGKPCAAQAPVGKKDAR